MEIIAGIVTALVEMLSFENTLGPMIKLAIDKSLIPRGIDGKEKSLEERECSKTAEGEVEVVRFKSR
ncbi:hypothetical protein Bca4012_019101 [Brassica carinata]